MEKLFDPYLTANWKQKPICDLGSVSWGKRFFFFIMTTKKQFLTQNNSVIEGEDYNKNRFFFYMSWAISMKMNDPLL